MNMMFGLQFIVTFAVVSGAQMHIRPEQVHDALHSRRLAQLDLLDEESRESSNCGCSPHSCCGAPVTPRLLDAQMDLFDAHSDIFDEDFREISPEPVNLRHAQLDLLDKEPRKRPDHAPVHLRRAQLDILDDIEEPRKSVYHAPVNRRYAQLDLFDDIEESRKSADQAPVNRRHAQLNLLDEVASNFADLEFMNMPAQSIEADVAGLIFCNLQDFGIAAGDMRFFQDSPTTRDRGADISDTMNRVANTLVHLGHPGNSLEQVFSLVYEANETIAAYLALFSGFGEGDKNFGAEETLVLTMFAMSRAMLADPGLQDQIERIYQVMLPILDGSDHRIINWGQVVLPANLPQRYRDPSYALSFVDVKLTTLRSTKNSVFREAGRIMANMHARIFAGFSRQWDATFVSAHKRQLIGYLSDPTSLGTELQTQGWFAANFPIHAFPDTFVTPTAAGLRLRRELLNSFIRTGLIDIAQSGDHTRLATVIVGIWQARPEDYLWTWDRNLYTRSWSRGGIVSWREWIQTELLQIADSNQEVKELVKTTLENTTGELRTEEKEAWTASLLKLDLTIV